MNAPLPPLPLELLSTWSSWRPNLSPSARELPSRHRSSRPYDHASPESDVVLPPIQHTTVDAAYEPHCSVCPVSNSPAVPELPTPAELLSPDVRQVSSPSSSFEWFTDSQQQPSRYIVEKTCEMICYLWFSQSSTSPSKRTRPDPHDNQSYFPHSNSSTASLQFSVSPAFVRFMQKVLETTQVSQSVIVLSLHYIYRMKARNRFTSGQAGSEYRVAMAALMMANKFVDDNTYTNKTWSEVSGIDLDEVNKMEREFLLGLDFGLYVDKTTYSSWLNLLKGLIMAKERESQHWRRSWCRARSGRMPRSLVSRHASSSSLKLAINAYRARSISPWRPSAAYPLTHADSSAHYHDSSVTTHIAYSSSGSKRSADDAFSPLPPLVSSVNRGIQSSGLTLQIPHVKYARSQPSANSASPSEPLQSLAHLSLGASPISGSGTPPWASGVRQDLAPQTLVSAYRQDEKQSHAAPQNLYYYALTCSPLEESNSRKARLQYHQPPAAPSPVRHVRAPLPLVVQSVSASPCDGHRFLPPVPMLPPFSEISRNLAPPYGAAMNDQGRTQERKHLQQHQAIPSAPFANAGPPGYHQFYPASSPSTSVFSHQARGRRF